MCSQIDLMRVQLPRRVHVHVVRYAASQVPTTFVGLERWIQEVWRDKEARLNKFYTDRMEFPVHNQQQSLPSRTKTLQVCKHTGRKSIGKLLNFYEYSLMG